MLDFLQSLIEELDLNIYELGKGVIVNNTIKE
jgi:hypothetical protein